MHRNSFLLALALMAAATAFVMWLYPRFWLLALIAMTLWTPILILAATGQQFGTRRRSLRVRWDIADILAAFGLTMFVAPLSLTMLWQYLLSQPDPRWLTFWVQAQAGPLSFVIIALVLTQRRNVRLYQVGLHTHKFTHNILAAITTYVLIWPLMRIVYQLARDYTSDWTSPQAHGIEELVRSTPTFGNVFLTGVVAIIIAPCVEELLFRGLLFFWLRKHLNPFAALLISSLAFALVHANAWPAPFPIFILAWALGYLAHRTNSLVGPIALHMASNAGSMLQLILQTT